MKLVALLLLAMSLTGCLSYQSRIVLPDGSKLSLPKDFSASAVVITSTTSNGTYTVRMTNVVARMNPEVMSKKTAHAVALFREGAAATGTAAGNAGKTMVKP